MYEISRMGKSIGTERGLAIGRAGGRKGWGVTANGHRLSFRADENVLELDSDGGCTTL